MYNILRPPPPLVVRMNASELANQLWQFTQINPEAEEINWFHFLRHSQFQRALDLLIQNRIRTYAIVLIKRTRSEVKQTSIVAN